ncbi:hypothetical protein [Streptomyces sp. TRM68367]|uniref:baeRF2 domain-containing protein n=1 Tax=Streptomyces sp. TRM68367 TaxID=2758415 RepID=UPI00165C4B97|nr:hypothetical protein [Streptomyces sp. TRM68367]MBC9727651.1 hypothetical protein [Streptomyces sp. TRM68367]
MKLTFLDPLFAAPGPWASIYLDTSQDIEERDKAIDLRWRHQRDALRAQGADAATVDALDAAVGTGPAVPGRHGRALFAAHGRLALDRELPEPPVRETARFGDLPDAMRLAVQRAPDIPYLAVRLTRDSARPAVDGAYGIGDGGAWPDPEEHVLVVAETGRWPTSRVTPGRRLSHLVPAEEWPHTAPRIAQELEDLTDRHGAEEIVLCRDAGDVWVSGVLANQLPIHLQNRTTVVEDEPGPADPGAGAGPSPALIETHVAHTLDGRLSRTDRLQTDTFLSQRARHPLRSEGVAAAVAALQRGQARALLLVRPDRPGAPDRLPERLWVGTEPPQIALSVADLETFGVTAVREEPADAALLYAAVRTRAELIVLPPGRTLTDGVGVLLRYRDVTDMVEDDPASFRAVGALRPPP